MEIFSQLTLGLLVTFGLRLAVPLLIFRFPLWGALAAMLTDAVDVYIAKLFNADIPYYPLVDKYFDLYYLSIELIVSLRWRNTLARNASIGLFVWRIIGVIGFTLTTHRAFLFLGPNLFENFYLFYTAYLQFRKNKKKDFLNSPKRLLIILIILYLPKIPQEYFLHVLQIEAPIEYLFPNAPKFLQ